MTHAITYKVNGKPLTKAQFKARQVERASEVRPGLLSPVVVKRDIWIESHSLPRNWKGATEWNPKNGKPRIQGRRALDNARSRALDMGDRLHSVDDCEVGENGE